MTVILFRRFGQIVHSLPSQVAFDHSTSFCGKDSIEKICRSKRQMKLRTADYHLLTSPDDIMWLLNIRGKDFKYSPLILSFATHG